MNGDGNQVQHHELVATFYEDVVPEGQSLVIRYQGEEPELKVLDVRPIGPDLRYQYVLVTRS